MHDRHKTILKAPLEHIVLRWAKYGNLILEGQKTLWKKKKVLVASIFSFS